ncbi:MAG: AMP-binding protein [Acidobacteria bacterium]|nr:AMP-binding protein [Acidobacteriota bacterium]MBI3428261.1 AMP-binding protein [Acidobacteriota bacterium]
MNAARITLDNLEKYGEYVSTWFEGHSFTNVERYAAACRLAEVLRAHGAQPGDRIVVMMLNSPDVAAAFTAIWAIGAVIVPVTPMWTAREVRYVLQDSGARLVITSPELAARLKEASADLPGCNTVLVIGATAVAGVTDITAAYDQAQPFEQVVDCAPDELALLLYTSGTTGNPKGVMLSHDNLIFIADAVYANSSGLGQIRGMQVLPLSHIYGVLMMNLGARMGNASYILKHFDAGQVLQLIESFRVQRLAVVPTMLTLLINHLDRAKYDYASLEAVGSGGAPLSEATRQEFARLFNCRVTQGYGLSESSGALTGFHHDAEYRVGSVGPALPGVELCVMDFNNQVLPPGEIGELCSRGRHIMQGYFNNPQATADSIIEGWLHTGDVGWMDADGYVYITDRKKDLIIKGGENISPREIEEGIYAHPAIAEAAVVGVPDELYGENLLAAVVLKPGQALSEEELKQHLSGYVTKFKVPGRVVFLGALPKGSTGKILKRAIKEQFAG